LISFPDIIANARQAFFQGVIDHIQLEIKNRSSTTPKCGASPFDPLRGKCDAFVVGRLVIATLQHVEFLPASAEEIDKTPAELTPWLSALSRVKCDNRGVCVNMEDYADLVSINKKIQSVLKEKLDFPRPQHIEYMAKQREKCGEHLSLDDVRL